jgi:hypothetical protein
MPSRSMHSCQSSAAEYASGTSKRLMWCLATSIKSMPNCSSGLEFMELNVAHRAAAVDRLFQLKGYQIGRMAQKNAALADEQAQQELSESVLKSRAQHEEVGVGQDSVRVTEKV